MRFEDGQVRSCATCQWRNETELCRRRTCNRSNVNEPLLQGLSAGHGMLMEGISPGEFFKCLIDCLKNGQVRLRLEL